MAAKQKGSSPGGWIQGAIKRPGATRAYCRRHGFEGVTEACLRKMERSGDPTLKRRAVLARTLKRLAKKRRRKGR